MFAFARKSLIWCTLFLLLFFSVSPLSMKPDDILGIALDQFVTSALMAAAFAIMYPRQALHVSALALLIPFGCELAQTVIPERFGYGPDLAVKLSGTATGMLLATAWFKLEPVRIAWKRQREAIKNRHKRFRRPRDR